MTLVSGEKNNWISSGSGKSCGVQGSVYGYSDEKDTTTPTCTIPAAGICTKASADGPAKCCISGETVADTTYKAWGCAMALDLNTSGGATDTKGAYAGKAKGFHVTLTADAIASGQEVRIAYAQGATSAGISPFVGGKAEASTTKMTGTTSATGSFDVLFSDVSCPPATWGTCTAPG
ncbi:MAG TPA: hypothetical protein VIV60_13765, partial [Polyangiaceae bacterium]